ncbi:MAG: universal stress protein [Acidobacteriaceae bacterium]
MHTDSTLHFNTIVIATDLTGSVTPALQYAEAIARMHNSVLVVVHVIDPVGYAFPDGAPAFAAADQACFMRLAPC